jgi:hypothetical protein
MLESIIGLSDWCHKECKTIYRLWRWRTMKQDESDGNPKFTMTFGLGARLSSHWKMNRRQFWQWRGTCKAYKNPILEFDVG